MLCPLMTTRTFWRLRQTEGWRHICTLVPEEERDPDDPARDPDWWPLSQLEGMAYDWTERQSPGTMPYDDMWTCDHHGVLFYPVWALDWAWARLIGRQQVVHCLPSP